MNKHALFIGGKGYTRLLCLCLLLDDLSKLLGLICFECISLCLICFCHNWLQQK